MIFEYQICKLIAIIAMKLKVVTTRLLIPYQSSFIYVSYYDWLNMNDYRTYS